MININRLLLILINISKLKVTKTKLEYKKKLM